MNTTTKLICALRQIKEIGGNLPDDRLTSKTGPNDAAQRGLMYVAARQIANDTLDNLKEPSHMKRNTAEENHRFHTHVRIITSSLERAVDWQPLDTARTVTELRSIIDSSLALIDMVNSQHPEGAQQAPAEDVHATFLASASGLVEVIDWDKAAVGDIIKIEAEGRAEYIVKRSKGGLFLQPMNVPGGGEVYP